MKLVILLVWIHFLVQFLFELSPRPLESLSEAVSSILSGCLAENALGLLSSTFVIVPSSNSSLTMS